MQIRYRLLLNTPAIFRLSVRFRTLSPRVSATFDMLHKSLLYRPQTTSKRVLTDLCEVEDLETGSILRTTFSFVDAHHAVWFGQVLGVRKYDLTVDDLRRSLHPISDETVYPEVTAGLTIMTDDNHVKKLCIKRPKLLCLDSLEETQLLPKMLAEEAHVLEFLKPYWHRNLVRYHRCVSKDGRIAGIALKKHGIILQYRYEDDPRELDIAACISGVQAGIYHLHSLGFAYNDLNMMDIALDKADQLVILDLESCRRFEETLLSGGTPP